MAGDKINFYVCEPYPGYCRLEWYWYVLWIDKSYIYKVTTCILKIKIQTSKDWGCSSVIDHLPNMDKS